MAHEFKSLKSGRVLITGHTGFKGVWLTLMLESLGIEPIGVSIDDMGKDSLYNQLGRKGQIEEYFIDIRDSKSISEVISISKPTVSIHLAAQSLVTQSYINPVESFEVNAAGTWNVVNALFKSQETEVVICATTDKVYRSSGKRKYVETDPLEGSDPYSCSKVAAEAAIKSWRPQFHKEGKSLISVRAGNVIGGGDRAKNRIMTDVVNAWQNNEEMKVRNMDATRPWQHALSPLFGYMLAAEKSNGVEEVGAYNFGPSESSLSVADVLNLSQTLIGAENFSYSSAKEQINFETGFLDLDSSLAIHNLGWKPILNQKESIESTIRWWKAVTQNDLTPREACIFDISSFLSRAL